MAELKPKPDALSHFHQPMSPRLHRRGRIEAGAYQRLPANPLPMSPRLHRRGRIEATRRSGTPSGRGVAGLHAFTGVAELKRPGRRRDRLSEGRSPRLHRRGRIEALATPGVMLPGAGRLHAFTGVAELKPAVRWRSRRSRRSRLHAFTGVAELKPGSSVRASSILAGVSTPSPAWPN